MIEYQQVKQRLLENPLIAQEYEKYKTEFEIARSLIHARLAAHMTQAEVAQKMLTSQAQIARMESGAHMPSLQSISKYAHAINQAITIEIRP